MKVVSPANVGCGIVHANLSQSDLQEVRFVLLSHSRRCALFDHTGCEGYLNLDFTLENTVANVMIVKQIDKYYERVGLCQMSRSAWPAQGRKESILLV